MKKFMLILLILGATVFISFKYSERVYINFLKIYYNKMYSEEELLKRSEMMYNKKMNKELKDFLSPLIVIYPGNREFKKIAALNYLQLGDSLKGAEILAGLADNGIQESHDLEEILKNLYKTGNYGDLLFFYDKNIMHNNVNTAFYYGVSLYKKGRYEESYKNLIYAKNNTFMLPEINFYLGLNLDKKGKIEESIYYIKSAYESDRFNHTYKKALIDMYRKSGLYKEAEVLLRSR